MKKVFGFILVFAVLSNMAFAQDPGIVTSSKPGWHKIGEVKADFKKENESIVVMGADQFKSIKLKVTDAPISINKVLYTMNRVPRRNWQLLTSCRQEVKQNLSI